MRKWSPALTIAATVLLLATTLHGATYDLTGTWNYTLSDGWAQGGIGCNAGPPASGTCTIVQTGDTFTFAYTSGVVCDPAESCTFSGSVAGNAYSCSTTDIVDNEGGTVTSTIQFTAASAESAGGSGNSLYTHPSGEWSCAWGNTLSLTMVDDGAPPTAYTLTVNRTGSGSVSLDPPGGEYLAGTVVKLTAQPDPNWQFSGWTGDVADTQAAATSVTMDANKTVTAAFVEQARPGWHTVSGTVSYNGVPMCAMVLANGQYMFSCNSSLGVYELTVPLDSNGNITIQAFVSGLSPSRTTTDTTDLTIDIDMLAAQPDSRTASVNTINASDASTPSGKSRITGTVLADGTPLCAMVLANGRYMFSCNANLGVYDLTVPLDGNGEITLYVFASGFSPYKKVFDPNGIR